ncbi:MAG: universal stress protein, partial [Methylococcales bacterium]|nr:universal stress protein [Methylococcales bacterium]
LAQSLSTTLQAKLTLLSVNNEETAQSRLPLPPRPGQKVQIEQSEQSDYLSQIANQLKTSGVDVDYAVRNGNIAEEIGAAAVDGMDLVVMSTHGRSGFKRLLIGSIATQMLQACKTPLLLLRPTGGWRSRGTGFRKLLVALDGSEFSEQVLPYVHSIAQHFGSEVLLLSVPVGSSSTKYRVQIEQYLENIAAELRGVGLKVQPIVTGAEAARTIVNTSEAEQVDLIMLATHGRGGFQRLMVGSVADQVVKDMPCPVFLLPVKDGKN